VEDDLRSAAGGEIDQLGEPDIELVDAQRLPAGGA